MKKYYLQQTRQEDSSDPNLALGSKLQRPHGRYGNHDDEEIVKDTDRRSDHGEQIARHLAADRRVCNLPRLSQRGHADDRIADDVDEALRQVDGHGDVGQDPGLVAHAEDAEIEEQHGELRKKLCGAV